MLAIVWEAIYLSAEYKRDSYLSKYNKSKIEDHVNGRTKKEVDNWGCFTNIFRFLSIGSMLLGTVFVYFGGKRWQKAGKRKKTTKS